MTLLLLFILMLFPSITLLWISFVSWDDQVAVLFVIEAMVCLPTDSAYIAKLVLALAKNVIASLEVAYNREALWTLAILQCLLVKFLLKHITLAGMRRKQTQSAKLPRACTTTHRGLVQSQNVLAGSRTEMHILIHKYHVGVHDPPILVLNCQGKRTKEGIFNFQFTVAATARASDPAELLNYVDSIMLHARITELCLMLTVSNEEILGEKILVAYLAIGLTTWLSLQKSWPSYNMILSLLVVQTMAFLVLAADDLHQILWNFVRKVMNVGLMNCCTIRRRLCK